ncbi:DUF4112 domain-containing protein [Calothrix sp. 336/3]|uniref:DUF4112 domain-containing protein n=1 Tax=Calothrix sp. 336/3 TaxID=1337936 RepID=UPI000551EAA6|nr:DUF4112 domain-containing protein [Calothrix sp. 336/3]AKG23630.1 hypothetical protein IJ00_22160 [Calothrix sp. 336/3]
MSQPRYSSIEPSAKAPTLKRLRQLANLLDQAIIIPGTRVGIGLDPLLGLIPIGGDFLGIFLSAYIILEAARLGVPQSTLGRMVINILIDALVGVIPLIGDLFDFAWTANQRNVYLLEEHLKFPSQRKKADTWFVILVLVGLFLVSILLVSFAVIVSQFVWGVIAVAWTALTGK